jgi:hypothetical protein
MQPRNIFGFLRRETQRVFGEGTYLFFPAARGGTAYTVVVPCTSSVARGRASGLAGVLSLPADTRTVEVDDDALPFVPRPDDILLFGNAVRNSAGVLIQDPAAPAQKFKITVPYKAPYHTHWRIEIERH